MILRYTKDVQKVLGSEVKPEPWLHVMIGKNPDTMNTTYYAIYVWDTRDVVEDREIDKTYDTIRMMIGPVRWAVDNKQKLNSDGWIAGVFNRRLVAEKPSYDLKKRMDKNVRNSRRIRKFMGR